MCWYTIDIRSSLLCEPTSPRVAIATSCDAISSHNRVESKLTNIRESTFCAWRHVICCRSFTNVTLLFDYFQSLYNMSTTFFFFFRNVQSTIAGNIETLSLKLMRIWPWICDPYYEWINIKLWLCLRCLQWCFSSHSNDMSSRQSSSAVKISCNVAPQCGDTCKTSCNGHATFFNFKGKRA